jgi:hypothetical protein
MTDFGLTVNYDETYTLKGGDPIKHRDRFAACWRRLAEAAQIAFPGGGMTAAGLRREWKRGRLVISRIAGKDFTTVNHIRGMIEQCHVSQSPLDCGNELKAADLHGLSSIEAATSALASNLTTFKARKKR